MTTEYICTSSARSRPVQQSARPGAHRLPPRAHGAHCETSKRRRLHAVPHIGAGRSHGGRWRVAGIGNGHTAVYVGARFGTCFLRVFALPRYDAEFRWDDCSAPGISPCPLR
eukprot:1332222-Prymnesium_polylepis.2